MIWSSFTTFTSQRTGCPGPGKRMILVASSANYSWPFIVIVCYFCVNFVPIRPYLPSYKGCLAESGWTGDAVERGLGRQFPHFAYPAPQITNLSKCLKFEHGTMKFLAQESWHHIAH